MQRIAAVGERLYTIDEVNELIPRLEIILARMQRRGLELRAALDDFGGESTDPELTMGTLLERRPELLPAVREMESLLRDIESAGGEFKGLDLGLVDFPAELNGERVLLCWQYGEKEVAFFHDPRSGFSGRRPLRRRRSTYLQ